MPVDRDQATALLHAWTKSVKKKLKDKAFAAKVDREIIGNSVAPLGADFDEHVRFVIEALKPRAAELGIAGKAAG